MFGGQDPQSRNDKQSDAKVHLTQSYSQRHKNEQHFKIICIN